MPVYRYKLSGPVLSDLAKQVGGPPTVAGFGPSAYVDITSGALVKEDLDDFMASSGYEYVEESPTDTPAEASGVEIGASIDFSTFTEKAAPVAADLVLIEDSAASGAKKKVQIGNLPGGTTSETLATVGARRTTTFAITSAFQDMSFDATDVETSASVIDHLAGTPDRVQVFQPGTYLVTYSMVVTPNATSPTSARVRLNDTSVVNGSESSCQNYAAEDSTLSVQFVVTLVANDFLTVQVTQSASTGTVRADAVFTVTKLNGAKGDTGSGSSITVQGDGSPLPNTPHSTLNFTGTGVTASDAGGGTATINIPSPGVFGTQFQDASNASSQTQTGTTWAQYLRLTTPVVPAGRYRIGWSYNWRCNSGSSDFRGRIELDGTTTLMSHQQESQDAGADQLQPAAGFVYVNLTNAAHTFDLDLSGSAAGVAATIADGRLEIWRVS